jgi:hypothetical protein
MAWQASVRPKMLRWLGASLVFLGCVLLALDQTRWDSVVAAFPGPGSHGLHASEILGFAIAVIGIAALWMGGSPR